LRKKEDFEKVREMDEDVEREVRLEFIDFTKKINRKKNKFSFYNNKLLLNRLCP
jgi:hypothetical protein